MQENNVPSAQKAVVLLNFGGPRHLEEVADFLYEILRDPNVIQLPFPHWLQNRFARKISKKRAVEVAEQYQQIGGKSPIVEATEQQRAQLEKILQKQKGGCKIYVAHRYLAGNAESVVKQIIEDQIEQLYAIPMYPHFSYATTGSSLEQLDGLLKKQGYACTIQVLRSYPNHPYYIEALSDLLKKELSQHTLVPQETLILCSAHGLPQSYVDKGDPYLMELWSTVESLRKQFPEWKFQLCFQSRVGPAKWLQPYTDELLPELAKQGVRSVLFVALSFVNDHLETLFEIDHTYFELARSEGLTPYRVPAVETHPRFIELLGEQTLLWNQGLQGMDLPLLLPPSQHFRRSSQWILYSWCLALLIALFYAIV
ncbi:MAG: ferrochelatase [SAR324 cluster bacterium]|nr:ferrochelatase [SAR324 cluster bacterium]